MKQAYLTIVLSFMALPGPAAAQGYENLDAIDRQVAAFLGADADAADASAIRVDRRLRVHACPAAPTVEWHGNRHDTVLVQCPVAEGWKLYVPVTSGVGTRQSPVVARGDVVTVTMRGAGFSVSRTGQALEGGARGEWIRVRIASAEELRARVLDPGAVGIELP